MAKVLWHGDAGCHTGFARVTHALGERLVRDYGHEIHVLALNHRGDDFPGQLDPSTKTPLWLYRPQKVDGNDFIGRTRILELLGAVEPDVVVEYNDPDVLLQLLYKNPFDPTRLLLQVRPIISYVPCDGTNLPKEWQRLTEVTNMVSMSRYGQLAYPGSKLVYHGFDPDQFWPVAERPITLSTGQTCKTKRELKEAFGYDPKGFLVLRIDKNSGRKDFAATFQSLVPVMKRHHDIQVHFHTQSAQHVSGVALERLFERESGIDHGRWFLPNLTDPWIGWPQQNLNGLINAADAVVSNSRGEGFGLTLLEAIGCGVPVIAQNVSAIPEVVGPGGILIEPQRLITVPSGQDLWLSDTAAFSDALEHLYESKGLRRDLGEAGAAHAKTFSWDVAAEKFDHYISALANSVRGGQADAEGQAAA
jgi:glycosyltransferase involved in cell wall biosynthesis